MLANTVFYLCIQSLLIPSNSLITPSKLQQISPSSTLSRKNNQLFADKNLSSTQEFSADKDKDTNCEDQNIAKTIARAALPIIVSFGILPTMVNAANIAVMDTTIDMEHSSLSEVFAHEQCLPEELKNFCPVNLEENLDLIDEGPYTMNRYIRRWYERGFDKYTSLYEKPASQLSQAEVNWLERKMSNPSFDEKWGNYIHAAHGTHVAGIIAKNNPEAHIVSVRFIPENQAAPDSDYKNFMNSIPRGTPKANIKKLAKIHLRNLAEHIVESNKHDFSRLAAFLTEKKITIVNGSFNTDLSFMTSYRKIFNREEFVQMSREFKSKMHQSNLSLYAQLIEQTPDTLYIFAAGNNSSDNDHFPVFPSFMSSISKRVISVASVDDNGRLSHFSNYGKKSVDLAAPGSHIESTAPGNQLIHMSGTSQAAPQVSRLAAKIHDIDASLKPEDIKDIIVRTVQKRDCLIELLKSGGEMNEDFALNIVNYMFVNSVSLDEALQHRDQLQ